MSFILSFFLFSHSWAASTPPNPFQDGYVLLFWDERISDADRMKAIDETIALGARHVAVPIFGCQLNLHSDRVGGCEVQKAEHSYRTAKFAISKGLQVTFLPILTTPKWEWRAWIKPKNLDSWFSSYRNWILGIITQMRELGIGHMELSVASEMREVYQYSERWTALLKDLKTHTNQPLFITVNWDDLTQGFWGESDFIGISAYFPLISIWPAPKATAINRVWRSRKMKLLALSKALGKPLYFTEVGYKNAQGSSIAPWDAVFPSIRDDDEQALCFEAFSKTWKDEKRLVRFQVWGREWPRPPSGIGFDPGKNKASEVLRNLFQARLSLAPGIEY